MKKLFLLATALALMLSANMLNLNSEQTLATNVNVTASMTMTEDGADYLPGYFSPPSIVGIAPVSPTLMPIGLYVPTAPAGNIGLLQVSALKSSDDRTAIWKDKSAAGSVALLPGKDVAYVREVARPWKKPVHGPSTRNQAIEMTIASNTAGAGGAFRFV